MGMPGLNQSNFTANRPLTVFAHIRAPGKRNGFEVE